MTEAARIGLLTLGATLAGEEMSQLGQSSAEDPQHRVNALACAPEWDGEGGCHGPSSGGDAVIHDETGSRSSVEGLHPSGTHLIEVRDHGSGCAPIAPPKQLSYRLVTVDGRPYEGPQAGLPKHPFGLTRVFYDSKVIMIHWRCDMQCSHPECSMDAHVLLLIGRPFTSLIPQELPDSSRQAWCLLSDGSCMWRQSTSEIQIYALKVGAMGGQLY